MSRATLVTCLLASASIGCSDSSVAPVGGTVTMNGQPFPGVRVQFQPTGLSPNPGSGSYAVTDAEGRYQLRQVDPDRVGRVVGPHAVRITTMSASRSDDRASPKEAIPDRYNAATQLTFDVPPHGTSDANFQLTTP